MTILAIISLVVYKTTSPETVADEEGLDISIAQDEGSVEDAGEGDQEELTIVETATAETKVESTADTTVLAKKDGARKGYLNRCVFLGDSRTVAMVNYGFFNDDAALAQIGISHPSFANNTFINNAGKEYTLKSYLASHQAPVIYIALGVNGINDPSEDHYKKTFIELIDKVAELSPNSNIVLMSIGPVNDNGPYKKTVQNSWIEKYNAFLLDTAKDKHIFYLDIAEVLKGSDGQVKSEYNGGDGLHYSNSGCEAIFNYIVEHPVPGISDDGEYTVKYIKPNPNRTKVTMDDGSGIDEAKLQELMNMMMEETPTTTAPSSTTTTTTTSSSSSSSSSYTSNSSESDSKKDSSSSSSSSKTSGSSNESSGASNSSNTNNGSGSTSGSTSGNSSETGTGNSNDSNPSNGNNTGTDTGNSSDPGTSNNNEGGTSSNEGTETGTVNEKEPEVTTPPDVEEKQPPE